MPDYPVSERPSARSGYRTPDPYCDVLRKLAEGTRRDGHGWQGWHIPDKAAISRARHRLSSEVMRELFLQGAGWPAMEVTCSGASADAGKVTLFGAEIAYGMWFWLVGGIALASLLVGALL
ncbi:transposase domain-containing protein [Nonomuraea sp. JJY05]|uniref:transposase domain-containing protein n=1 Tax=Nonomuraea sp. JJY05 TaxID=3350255 RepID=UPI00373F427D